MLVQFGNTALLEDGVRQDRDAPCVTYANLNDLDFTAADLNAVKLHLADAIVTRKGITSLEPGHEAVLAMVHPDGIVAAHCDAKPTWVWSDNEAFGAFLGQWYDCPVGIPDDVEDTHNTLAGPPGVTPAAATDLQMNITQNGRDIVARALGGGAVGVAGTGTAATATTLTTALTTSSTTQYTNQRVFVYNGTSVVWGNIISCTSGASAVLTVDRWYSAATPGGAAASTPSSGYYFIIADGAPPAWFVGLSASSTAPASPDTHTSLTSEITTASGGLVRQIAPYAHTASANTWTLTPVYTANGSDSLPVTIASYGVFTSMVVSDTTGTMLFYNTFGTTATLSASGDQLTVTITCTTS